MEEGGVYLSPPTPSNPSEKGEREIGGEIKKGCPEQYAQISLGHLSFTGTFSYPGPYDRTPSATAMAARYWRKTMGLDDARWAGWLITVDIMQHPAGASQTFVPRPRPATWVVAAKVKPVGSLERSFGFLRGGVFLVSGA